MMYGILILCGVVCGWIMCLLTIVLFRGTWADAIMRRVADRVVTPETVHGVDGDELRMPEKDESYPQIKMPDDEDNE